LPLSVDSGTSSAAISRSRLIIEPYPLYKNPPNNAAKLAAIDVNQSNSINQLLSR
jgi:hypothetical protein